jgi:site-specific DNA recombinase
LLSGLLHCGPCGCAMTPAHASKGVRRYCYYVCTQAQKRGWRTCPSRSVPAAAIERFVLEELGHSRPTSRVSLGALPEQQRRLVHERVERIDYDRGQGKLAITYRSNSTTCSNPGETQP